MREIVSPIDEPSYFDRVTAQVHLVDGHPSRPGNETLFVATRGQVSESEVRREFETLLLNQAYMLRVERSATHWGGAAENLTLIGQIASDTAAAIAVWEGLKRLAQSLSDRRAAGSQEPLTEEAAVRYASQMIAIRYPVARDQLEVTEVALDLARNGARVELRVTGQVESFSVELTLLDGATTYGKIVHRLGG